MFKDIRKKHVCPDSRKKKEIKSTKKINMNLNRSYKTSIFEIRVSYMYTCIVDTLLRTYIYTNSIVNYYFLNSHKNNVIKKNSLRIFNSSYVSFTGYGYHNIHKWLYHIVERKRE